MNWRELAKHLQINERGIACLEHVEESKLSLETICNTKSNEQFFEAVKQQALYDKLDYREVFAYVYMVLAARAYDKYKEEGIDDEIYYDTMMDLVIWSDDCYKKFGTWGIDEYGWLIHHVQLKIFKLGRLQFQPITLGEALVCETYKLEKGEKVLNVHIPAGETLDHDKCKASYKMAKQFFKDGSMNCICSSWLLNPVYKTLLPASSNIVQFQKDYCIYEVDDLCMQAEERIFGEVQSNPNLYAQDTTLQKVAATYLKQGKRLGIGKGVLKVDE